MTEKEQIAIKRLRQETCPATYMPDFDKNEYIDILEKGLSENNIQKEAWKIVVNKKVDFSRFSRFSKLEYYNDGLVIERRLTEAEYDILKKAEVLVIKNDINSIYGLTSEGEN